MTLSTGGFRRVVTFSPAPIATGWSDPCREGLAPSQEPCLSTAHDYAFGFNPPYGLRVADACEALISLRLRPHADPSIGWLSANAPGAVGSLDKKHRFLAGACKPYSDMTESILNPSDSTAPTVFTQAELDRLPPAATDGRSGSDRAALARAGG